MVSSSGFEYVNMFALLSLCSPDAFISYFPSCCIFQYLWMKSLSYLTGIGFFHKPYMTLCCSWNDWDFVLWSCTLDFSIKYDFSKQLIFLHIYHLSQVGNSICFFSHFLSCQFGIMIIWHFCIIFSLFSIEECLSSI